MPAAGALGAAAKTESYVYGNMNWKDKVTSVDGKEIIYDAIGNLLNYDHNGVRAEKGVNDVTKSCTLNGKNIVYMAQGDVVAMIDANVKPVVEYDFDV